MKPELRVERKAMREGVKRISGEAAASEKVTANFVLAALAVGTDCAKKSACDLQEAPMPSTPPGLSAPPGLTLPRTPSTRDSTRRE